MNPKNSHKIIAMGGMAAAIAVGVYMFSTGSHPASSMAETAAPPPPVAQTADVAPAAMTPTMAAPAAVAPVPEAASVARDDSVATAAAVTSTATALGPKPAHSRSPARANSSAGANSGAVAPGGSSEDSASETVANRVERLTSTDVLAPQPISISSPADDANAGMSAVLPASDSQITRDVKTAIAGDVTVKDFNIAVSTTDGVVALTGSVANQGAIDQAKDVAAKVKDVKRVDTSALILASL